MPTITQTALVKLSWSENKAKRVLLRHAFGKGIRRDEGNADKRRTVTVIRMHCIHEWNCQRKI